MKFFFYVPITVIQGEGPSHAMQFAQRLRDTADEELVTTLGNFRGATYRELDLAEELDRADEAEEAEVDEETPSHSQHRQLLRDSKIAGRSSLKLELETQSWISFWPRGQNGCNQCLLRGSLPLFPFQT